MAFILRAAKWIAHIIMALILIVGLVTSFGMKFMEPTIPLGPDDLEPIKTTVKTLEPTPTGFLLRTAEYPTNFFIVLIPPPDKLKSIILPGEKVTLSIKKGSEKNLAHLPAMQVYRLVLDNGALVFDISSAIRKLPNADASVASRPFHYLIAVPALYFLALALYPRARRMLSKRAKEEGAGGAV